jgi:hypothetical protein
MNNFFDFVDKYKFGILGAIVTYIGIFMYLQLTSVPNYFEIKAFNEGARIEIPIDEVEIKPENIEVPSDFQDQNITNTVRDLNDTRKQSDKDWSAIKSDAEIEKQVKDEERKMFEEAGGDAKRKAILDQAQKNDVVKNKDVKSDPTKTSNPGEGNSAKGSVMVEWSLKNRTPHLNDEWHVRNPGYTCGKGARGRVVIDIKVGPDGRVKSATCDQGASSISNPCMLEQALKYAQMSRFNYSGAAGALQSGKIFYTFVAQ